MFAKFLRANQYPRKHTVERSVVDKCAALGISGETSSGGSVGVTLLPATTVEACLFDRRRNDLVKPFKLSLLNLASQEAEQVDRMWQVQARHGAQPKERRCSEAQAQEAEGTRPEAWLPSMWRDQRRVRLVRCSQAPRGSLRRFRG